MWGKIFFWREWILCETVREQVGCSLCKYLMRNRTKEAAQALGIEYIKYVFKKRRRHTAVFHSVLHPVCWKMQKLFESHEHVTEGAAILCQSSLCQRHHKQGRRVAKVSNASCANTFQLFIGKEWTKGLCPEECRFKAKRQQTVLLLYEFFVCVWNS